MLQNFFAGILILWRRPFIVGDQIRIRRIRRHGRRNQRPLDAHQNLRRRARRHSERRHLHQRGAGQNGLRPRRVRFVVGIGYLDDIEKATRNDSGKFSTKPKACCPIPGRGFTSRNSPPHRSISRFISGSNRNQANVLKVSDQVATGIKYALDEAGIDMPYPHSVVLFHDATGTRDGDIERAKYLSARSNKRRTAKIREIKRYVFR